MGLGLVPSELSASLPQSVMEGLLVIRDKTAFPMSSKSLTTSVLLGHFWRHRNRISHRCSIAFPVSPRSNYGASCKQIGALR